MHAMEGINKSNLLFCFHRSIGIIASGASTIALPETNKYPKYARHRHPHIFSKINSPVTTFFMFDILII